MVLETWTLVSAFGLPNTNRKDLRKHPHGHATTHQAILTRQGRRAFIKRAQVWTPTDIPAKDLRVGPQGRGAFAPDSLVICDYVEKKLLGTTRKFACAIGPHDVVKVRYGGNNGKVEAKVLASRLLWALGFGADRVYPVRVKCRGCPPDPWTHHAQAPGSVVFFDLAAIEREPAGHEMTDERGKKGWSWSELDEVDEAEGGAPRAQRDALKLLAVLMQHTDSKAVQQRLLCLPGGLTDHGCEKPFMFIHDVGNTFGHANFLDRAPTSSLNFVLWSRTPVWRDVETCRGHLSKSAKGTLGSDPAISEAGRRFLAGLLEQLTDRQLHDLFEVARVDRRSRRPNSSALPASVDGWVAAFKEKRQEIVNARCPS